MKREYETTLYFKRVIQMLITEEEFRVITNELLLLPVKQRKAFWNLIMAGFSTKLAFKNCKNLYELRRNHNLEYVELLRMILFVDKELKSGIYSKRIAKFKVN